MKNNGSLWAGLLALLLAAPAAAVISPQVINFQGKLLDPTTNLPKTGIVPSITFRLYDAATLGNTLWTEVQNNVALTNGVFNVQLGVNTALPQGIFLTPALYLGITVQGDTEMAPRGQLATSPSAFTASQLASAGSVNLVADATYSTFTSAGNLIVPYGLVGSTGTFAVVLATGVNSASIVSSSGITVNAGTLDVNGSGGITNAYGLQTGTLTVTGPSMSVGGSSFTVTGGSATVAYGLTAASATFTAAGGYSLTLSSGMILQNGTLDVNGDGGITNSYGLQTGTLTVTGPAVTVGGSSFTVAGGSATVGYGLTARTLSLSGGGASAGGVMYMTAAGSMSVTSVGTAGFRLVSNGSAPPTWSDPTIKTMTSMPLTPHSGASAVANTSLTVRKTGLFRVANRLTVNQLTFTVGAVTTAGTYKICVYTEDGLTKVIDVTSGAPAVGANNVAVAGAPVLDSGLYYVAMGCATTCSNTVFQWTTISVAGLNAATVPAGKEVLEGTTTHTSGTCNATLPAITPAISSTPIIRFDN